MKKKLILLTGASGQIGSGIVDYFLKKNYKIIGLSRKTKSNKKNFYQYSFDLKNFDKYEQKLKQIVKNHGKIDHFIHSAGILEIIPINIVQKEDIYKSLDINLISPFLFIKFMKDFTIFNKNSSAVLISSLMSELSDNGMSVYSSSKSACLGLVRSSALEFAKYKIRINSISPGTINSRMFKKYKKKIHKSKIDELIARYPLGLGHNLDINLCIEYLISDKNKWVTGQNIVLDGGYSIK